MSAPSPLARRLVRRYTEANMNSQVTILRGTLGALDPVTGVVGGQAGSTTVYEGKARIHTVSGSGSLDDSSGGPTEQRTAVISIPIGSPMPHRDDLVTVQATNRDSDGSEADTNLNGRTFRVLDVEGGSYFGDARRMTCTQLTESRYWTGA